MSTFVVCCPECGSQDLEELGYKEFECNNCKETFDLDQAEVEA
jgi:hypothetical protein